MKTILNLLPLLLFFAAIFFLAQLLPTWGLLGIVIILQLLQLIIPPPQTAPAMTKKHTDLSPLLDYFDMLRRYEQKGYIEVKDDDHEAYITQAAFATLLPSHEDTPEAQRALGAAVSSTVQNIRYLAAYRAAAKRGLDDYTTQPFSLHIVGDEPPHDLVTTILLTRRRAARALWMKREHIDVINYQEEAKQ